MTQQKHDRPTGRPTTMKHICSIDGQTFNGKEKFMEHRLTHPEVRKAMTDFLDRQIAARQKEGAETGHE
jgi:hypothetical protein